MRPALAEHGRELGLGVVELVHQALVALGLLDGVEVAALDVLEHRVFERGAVVDLDDDHRHLVQAGHLGRSPAPLAGDDLVAVRKPGQGPHHDRLDDAALADRRGEAGEVGPEALARVARVRAQELDRHLAGAARPLDDGAVVADVADQRGEAAPEAEFGRFFGHGSPSSAGLTRP